MDEYKDLKPTWSLFGVSALWIAFAVGLLAVAILAVSALNWFAKPLEMSSPESLQRLSREANDTWQALEAKQRNIVNLEQQAKTMVSAYGEDQSKWPQGKRQEYQQLLVQVTNLKTSYNNDCGQYKAFWNDKWRALPAPKGIPQTCEMR